MKLEFRRGKQLLPQILKHVKSSRTWAVHLPPIWAQAFCCWPKGSLGGLVIGGRVWDKGAASLACSKKVIPKACFTVPPYWEGKVTTETQNPQHLLIPGALTGSPKGSSCRNPNPHCVWLGILLLRHPAGSEQPCVSQHWEYFPLKFFLCLEAAAFCPRTHDHSTQLIQALRRILFNKSKIKRHTWVQGRLTVH